MPKVYSYPIINGRGKLLGYYSRNAPLMGRFVVVYYDSPLKQKFLNNKPIFFTVPLKTQCVADDGVEYIVTRFIDAAGLTKKQINTLRSPHG